MSSPFCESQSLVQDPRRHKPPDSGATPLSDGLGVTLLLLDVDEQLHEMILNRHQQIAAGQGLRIVRAAQRLEGFLHGRAVGERRRCQALLELGAGDRVELNPVRPVESGQQQLAEVFLLGVKEVERTHLLRG